MKIDGKVVLITGASEGLGAACADAFRRRGARLSLTARNEAKLRETGGANALVVAGDITQPETRERVVSATLEPYGAIDILINNAGVGLYSPAWKAPMESARAMFELNFLAPVALTQLVAPVMRRQRGGTVVNVGSIAGMVTLPWFTLYSASKYALGSLTDGLRMERKRDGIHAITVCPGYLATDFQKHVLAGTRPPLSMQRRRTLSLTAAGCPDAIAHGLERKARALVAPRPRR